MSVSFSPDAKKLIVPVRIVGPRDGRVFRLTLDTGSGITVVSATYLRQLGVDLILESSVVTADGRIRITVQLIDATTDLHIWVGRYEPVERDVLALQTAVAKAVARDVHAAVTGRLE